jgi:NitT/TauT family transport system ATP-binding protein
MDRKMAMIHIENVTHTYALPGKNELTALREIDLSLEKGEFVAVIGESGCGKSTLLNLVAGLLVPSSGVVRVKGEPVTAPHYSRMMMFQKPSLLPWLTVAENIAFGCKLRGEKIGLREKVERFIDLMGLSGFAKVFPGALSMGMLQRAALALSLIGEPEILLLDECFSNIDVFNRDKLLQLVISVWQQLRLTVLHVTHDIEEALLMGQRIVVMGERPGKIKHIFPIALPYPRNPLDMELNRIKEEILEGFT